MKTSRGCLAFCLAAFTLAHAALAAPHVVVILADDLGWGDVGWHGGEIATPNLDRLAASGAKLEQFYVQPVCSPTRAALMTGRYPMRYGLQVSVIRPWAPSGLPLEERLLPQALQQAGYTTAMLGKWHLGHFQRAYLPTQRGFDTQYGHYNGALDYFTHQRDGGHDWHRNDQENRDEGYTTALLGDEAVRLIGAHDPARPLFLYLAFNAPHSPLQATETLLARYAHIADKKRRAFAAMVHGLDEQVGRIAAALEQRGMAKDTLTIFSSDNGGPVDLGATNGPLRGKKATLYEGGIRVPAFACWPARIAAGTVVTEPLHIVDWFPTLLRLAGATADRTRPLDGRDAWPTISEGKPSPHDAILLNTTPGNGALRSGPWKLVLNGGVDANDLETSRAAGERSARVELFQLVDDPFEKNDLAARQPEKVAELRARLDAFAGEASPPKAERQPKHFAAPRVWGQVE